MRFIERNTRTAWRIEALRRENIPEYPMKALREAITNAVMHRDWFMDGANVFVELYTDRIEVSSPGTLPKGMTLADLGHKTVRRNALIADLLHRIEFIEKAGTGIKRIRDEARDQGCPSRSSKKPASSPPRSIRTQRSGRRCNPQQAQEPGKSPGKSPGSASIALGNAG